MRITILYLWLLGSIFPLALSADEQRPNVVIFLSDDQGWGDFSINGNRDLSTPNIDALAKSGASFENFYVCPVCSPTRAEFLTGRYHPRGGVFGTSAGGERLDLDESTFIQSFQAAGYATAAFGKWHNGAQPPYHPNVRGFDEFYGFCCGHWGHYFSPMLEHNGEVVTGNGFVTNDFTDHAIEFIANHHDEPFLVYLPYNTPHSPMQVPDQYWDRFENKPLTQPSSNPAGEKPDHTRAALAMCENIDDNVGRVLDKLNELELADNTIVVYFCDNGPNGWRFNGGLKGSKGSTDEGGIRSPLFVRWPGNIEPNTHIKTLAGAIDLRPTLLRLCGIDETPIKPLDGVDLTPELLGNSIHRTPRLIFSHWSNRVSVRSDRFRLDHEGNLFDLSTDRSQRHPVNAQHPDVAAELQREIVTWRETVLAELDLQPRPYPVGYKQYLLTPLSAGDATVTGAIKRSNQHPNDSFWTNWKNTTDEVSWPVEVLTAGRYQVDLYHTIRAEDVGVEMQLSFQQLNPDKQQPDKQTFHVSKTIETAYDPPLVGAKEDRFKRMESYVKKFQPINIGEIELPAGQGTLALRATKVPGKRVIDFRLLMLKRISP